MNNKQIANQYAQGATHGTGSNLFIEGDTIYSYGRHFPIATRLPDGGYWVNPEQYSQSTTRHQTLVKNAIG